MNWKPLFFALCCCSLFWACDDASTESQDLVDQNETSSDSTEDLDQGQEIEEDITPDSPDTDTAPEDIADTSDNSEPDSSDLEPVDLTDEDTLDASEDSAEISDPDLQDLTDIADSSDTTVDEDQNGELCEGACRYQNLDAVFGNTTYPLEGTYFGLTAPEQSGDPTTLYIEAYTGYDDCPEENSAPPIIHVLLNNTPLPLAPGTTLTMEDGLTATLLDYEGVVTDAIFLSATAIEINVVDAEICEDCVGTEQPDAFLALDVEIVFDGGSVTGHIYGSHCQSMDLW